MNIVSEVIDQYCLAHSTKPSAVCEALEKYTRENIPYAQMVSGPLVGSFLQLLVQLTHARRILEVGCFTGYSALAMAEKLSADGELITLDVDPNTNAVAKSFWEKSPHGKKIRSILGPALQSMDSLKGPFDLVFIDADKKNYLNYFRKALELTSINALIVADNTLWSGRVVDKPVDEDTKAIQDLNDWVASRSELHCTLLPVRDGLMVARKQG